MHSLSFPALRRMHSPSASAAACIHFLFRLCAACIHFPLRLCAACIHFPFRYCAACIHFPFWPLQLRHAPCVHVHAHWMCIRMLTGCAWACSLDAPCVLTGWLYVLVEPMHTVSCTCMCMRTQPHAHACAHACIHKASQTVATISQSTFAACMHIHIHAIGKTAHACCETIRQHNPHTSPHARSVR